MTYGFVDIAQEGVDEGGGAPVALLLGAGKGKTLKGVPAKLAVTDGAADKGGMDEAADGAEAAVVDAVVAARVLGVPSVHPLVGDQPMTIGEGGPALVALLRPPTPATPVVPPSGAPPVEAAGCEVDGTAAAAAALVVGAGVPPATRVGPVALGEAALRRASTISNNVLTVPAAALTLTHMGWLSAAATA